MHLLFDWKFYVMLLVTLAGIAVPVLLWRVDANGRSLQLKVASSTSLQPEIPGGVSGLRLTLDGTDVDRPFVTVLELTNTGNKPILASDFEQPIYISVDGSVQIIKIQKTNLIPKDLSPNISNNKDKITLAPLLLNPGDAITISAITAGGKPNYSAFARIAGVQTITLVDGIERKDTTVRRLTLALASLLLFSSYFAYASAVFRPSRFEPSRTALGVAALSAVVGGTLMLDKLTNSLQWSKLESSIAFAFMIVIGAFLSLFLYRKRPELT